jgi:hypothetical protein
LGHLLGSILGLVFAIFGTFALGTYLTRSCTGRLGLVAMVMKVLGSSQFLPLQGFLPSPHPRRAGCLTGIKEFEKLPLIFANTMFA